MDKENDKLLKSHKLLSERPWKYDQKATPEDLINDLRTLQINNPDKHITRNFYRAEGNYSESTYTKVFGTFLEFRRQAGLEFSRQQHRLERQIAKHASTDHYKEFFNNEVLPYHQKYELSHNKDLISILICSDIHDLEVDRFALSVFLDQCRIIQPNIIIFNGDIYDLYEFSKFDKDPRLCKPVERLVFVRDHIWKVLREICPNSQIDFIVGNHELRLLKLFADSNPYLKVILSDFVGLKMSDIFGLDEFKINFYSKVDLSAYSNKEIEKELEKNYKVYFDCFVATHKPSNNFGISGTNGHLHKGEFKSFTTLNNGIENKCTWVQTPALHKTDAVYINGISQANMGFSLVYISQKTKEVIQQLFIVGNNFSCVNGILYKRN